MLMTVMFPCRGPPMLLIVVGATAAATTAEQPQARKGKWLRKQETMYQP